MDDIKIKCPKCHWEADGLPHWRCTCGYAWDTFSTGGRCPACHKVWEETQCVPAVIGGCLQLSPHLDWYEGLNNIVDALKASIKKMWEEEQYQEIKNK